MKDSVKHCNQIIDPRDIQLDIEEAQEIIKSLELWPGILAEVLIHVRGTEPPQYVKDKDYSVFHADYVSKDESIFCPVYTVRSKRGLANTYLNHLSAWRSIRNAIAEILNCSLPEAHSTYNELLIHDPKQLSKIFKRYLNKKISLSGVKTKAWYILYELVDDFGNVLTSQDLSYETYLIRYHYFHCL